MRAITTVATVLVSLVALSRAIADTQQRFPTPDAAAKALDDAARAKSTDKLKAVLGPDSDDIVSSGDPVADAAALARYAKAAAEGMHIETLNDGAMAVIHIGHDDWPLPIPLVKDADGWRFDTASGKQELLNRRIGRNELDTIEVCRTYVQAQKEYAAKFHVYAQKVNSSPGKKDGLYWEASAGDKSPLGPFIAEATAEGYRVQQADEPPGPYHGYYYRILTSQGPHAPGGAKSYVNKDGKMTGGFALLAWPAEHGASGIMTFQVGPQGVVFQKDLGDQTEQAAKALTAFDPDESWAPTR